MERYLDEGTRTYSPFAARTEVSPEFEPRSHVRSFDAVAVRVPRDMVFVTQADPDRALLERYVQGDEVVFVVHPETWRSADVQGIDALRALPLESPVRVAPTASTRTVLAVGATPAHFLKLHYPRRISRFNRRLRRVNIETSVSVSREVATIDHERFAYLPDVLGVGLRRGDEWGFLVREVTPRPAAGDARFVVPFFALYGGDLDHADHPPLLVQWIQRLGVSAESFVTRELMIPVVECFALAARRGIWLESHAQNVLVEIDSEWRPRRIVHRDFDVWTDAHIDPRERREHYSLVYDHFVGRELFDYLLKTVAAAFRVDAREVHAQVAAAFHAAFGARAEMFPSDTTYYFTNEILPGNEVRLAATGRAPEWR